MIKDYKSKVPGRTYSSNLEEQKKELKNDAMLARFAQSRKELSTDPHRPLYHFVSPESTLNDPNGLCFWQGKWHLFYQGYPPEDPRQHWGHTVSNDLIHWKDLPYAIYPDPEECCYSGAAFVEEDRVIAMYHGTKAGNMVAISTDPLLLNWDKLTGKAVIPQVDSDPQGRPYRVFDPCIWKEGEYYYSLSGGHLEGEFRVDARKADHLFRSRDLITWTYMGEFVENFRFPQAGDDGACPYFWPIGDKHILLTFSHRRAAQYIIGKYDKTRQRLIAQKSGNLNTGAVGNGSIHAPSAFPDGKGGLVCLYNINNGKPTRGWDHIMSLPRSYTLSDQGELLISPAGDYESLRTKPVRLENMKLPANKEVVIESVRGTSLELKITIAPGPSRLIDLNVFRAPDKSEFTSIQLKREAGLPYGGWTSERVNDSLISIDSSYSSLAGDVAFRGTETAEFRLEKEEAMELHVFLDKSVVEVFINGRQAILQRVYPDKKDSMGVSLTSRGNGALCSVLESWEMESIYA